MKYTKTVPYFKEGDKIDKAAKNLPKKQRKAILKVSSTQKAQERKDKLSSVGANFKKPTARVDMPALTLEAKKLTAKTIQSQPLAKTFGRDLTEIKKKEPEESWDKLSFGKAFNAADKKGLKTFTWRGKLYATKKKEDVVNKTEDAEKKKDIPRKPEEAEIKEKPFRVGSRTGYVSDTVEDILNGVNQKEPSTQNTPGEIGSSAYKNYPRTVLEPTHVLNWKDTPIMLSKNVGEDGKENARLDYSDGDYYTRTIHNGDTIYGQRNGSPFQEVDFPVLRKEFLSAEDKAKKKQAESKKVKDSNSTTNTINTPQLTIDGNTTTYREDNPYTRPRYYRREFNTNNAGVQVPTYFSGSDPEDLKKVRDYALVNKGPYFQAQKIFNLIDQGQLKRKGGTINKYEKGTRGVARTNQEQHALDMTRLPKRNIFQHMLGISPNSYNTGRFYNNASGVKTPETVSRHITPFGRDETLINKPVSYGNLTSRRTIHKGDTTYTQPNGYETKNPSFINSFTQADKRYWDGLEGVQSKQQGGQVQQQDANKETLVADFVVRYLKTMGVPEEMIVTPEGSVNPEYEEELTAVITEIDSPEFWKAYQDSPDEIVTQVIRERNPNAVTMAKKGAKLQKLSQLRIYKK